MGGDHHAEFQAPPHEAQLHQEFHRYIAGVLELLVYPFEITFQNSISVVHGHIQ